MNRKKMATPLIIAVILAIFAMMIGPASAVQYNIGKDTITKPGGTVDNSLTYAPGDTVYYRMTFTPTSEAITLLKVTDRFPDNSETVLFEDSLGVAQHETKEWETSWVVPDDWTETMITNRLIIDAYDKYDNLFTAEAPKTSFIDITITLGITVEETGCQELTFTPSFDGPVQWHQWIIDGVPGPVINTPPAPMIRTFNDCSGMHTVTLRGGNGDLTEEFTLDNVVVPCPPNAVAEVNPAMVENPGDDATFSSASTPGANGAPIVSETWTFSDGQFGGPDPVTRPIPAEGVMATLTVVDELGCEDTDTVFAGPESGCTIRLYGTFGEGAGDDSVGNENWPYTDPEAPFFPENPQAPRKDFMTFNPAIMDHNQHPPNSDDFYDELDFYYCSDGTQVERPQEKVFKRMWYEKEWFKDRNKNGEWDVVVETRGGGQYTTTLSQWNNMPEWVKVKNGLKLVEWNNPEGNDDHNQDADIYAPAIIQEFTYMTLDDWRMPIMVEAGSEILIPMAHNPNMIYRGLNSFDADGDGDRDPLKVESEATLNLDIDGDGDMDHMNPDGLPLTNDESVVFVLDRMYMEEGGEIQLFDHRVKLNEVFDSPGDHALFNVCDNEGGVPNCETDIELAVGETKYFYRGNEDHDRSVFYLTLISADAGNDNVLVQMGRLFGRVDANIGTSTYWNQKAFIVDGVFYSVSAIMVGPNGQDDGDCFKYISIRQKLPKFDIKIYGKHLETWDPDEILPEMAPFSEPHEIIVDVLDEQFVPGDQQDKIGEKVDSPPLVITYVDEDIEERYKGSLLEILDERIGTEYPYSSDLTDVQTINSRYSEAWTLEWYHTYPHQYTEFKMPAGQKYLVTLSWRAPEAENTIWDGDKVNPVDIRSGDRVKFWYEDCSGPLYIDKAQDSIRLFGTFDEGAGDHSINCENPPYTDPEGPFFPQHPQAPHKDFLTFNPAIMDHNQAPPDSNDYYDELDFYLCEDGLQVERPQEKVFKRMWYEKEWFKDRNKNGEWDVVIETSWGGRLTMTLAEWNNIPEWQKVRNGYTIVEWNNPEGNPDHNQDADIYAPAIVQEFTYMTLDDWRMPIMVEAGSEILIPMAHDPALPYRGLNSFDADGDGTRDALRVESEATLDMDIDNDFDKDHMNPDGIPLNSDESVVLVLGNKYMVEGSEIQYFDHRIKLNEVFGSPGSEAIFDVCDNEGGNPNCETNIELAVGETKYFYRGNEDHNRATLYLKLISADAGENKALVEVGRIFGHTDANIGSDYYWNQKAFIVDGVFYSVAAIMTGPPGHTDGDCFKYITFRQKLPKFDIKIFGKHLETWDPDEVLPEMAPFSEPHEIIVDVLDNQFVPMDQQDKIGEKVPRPPLKITYVEEDIEPRFKGSLLEILGEQCWEDEDDCLWPNNGEGWMLEWFHTYPHQYTSFVLPEGELYLMTLAWYAPEAETTIWNGDPDEPIDWYTGDRAKFWYDPADPTDIYINRIDNGVEPEQPGPIEIWDTNGNGHIEKDELKAAILDYLSPNPTISKADLKILILDYLP